MNISLAKQHAEIASELFDNNIQKDLYYNAEGNNGLAKKLSDDISLAINNLQKAVGRMTNGSSSNQSQPQLQQQQQTSGNTTIKQIKQWLII